MNDRWLHRSASPRNAFTAAAPHWPVARFAATRSAADPIEAEADRLAATALARHIAPAASPHAAHDVLKGTAGGAPLDAALNDEMSQRFGFDFSTISVHAEAGDARRMNAAAYTQGTELRFAPGRYAPGTSSGRRLIAHELAHVVQQRAAAPGPAPMARQPLASVDVTKLGEAALLQRATTLTAWFATHLIDDAAYDDRLQQSEDLFREIQARAGAPATDADLESLRAHLVANSPRSAFEQKIRRGELLQYQSVRNEQGVVVGYLYESGGYWEVLDVGGSYVSSGEKPLETPLIDPLDLIPFELVASLGVKAATIGGRTLLKAGAKMLAKDASKAVVEEGARLGVREAAKEGATVATKETAKTAASDAARSATMTGSELAAKAVVQAFRRGEKFASVGAVSLKRLRNVLGRAGTSPSNYKLVKVSKKVAAQIEKEVGDVVWGWVEKDGAGALIKDAAGRPIINFTPRALASLEQAVKTFGHEAKHIKDFAAGMTTSSEALAEKAGEKLWLVVSESLAK